MERQADAAGDNKEWSILKYSKLIQDSIIPFRRAERRSTDGRGCFWAALFQANAAQSDGLFIDYSLVLNAGL